MHTDQSGLSGVLGDCSVKFSFGSREFRACRRPLVLAVARTTESKTGTNAVRKCPVDETGARVGPPHPSPALEVPPFHNLGGRSSSRRWIVRQETAAYLAGATRVYHVRQLFGCVNYTN